MSKVFRDTANKLCRDGWTKRSFRNDRGWCLVGALAQVAGVSTYLTEELFRELHRELRSRPDYNGRGLTVVTVAEIRTWVITWNDLKWRRQWQVIRVLRNIARRLESEERAKALITATSQVETDRRVLAELEQQFNDIVIIGVDVAENREPALVD